MKLTVTVVIPAHNEQTNIQAVLRDVLAQKQSGYSLEKIIVLSDGSSDHTVARARLVGNKLISVVQGKNRIGKAQRLNQIFKVFKSNVLVVLDADIKLADRMTLANLVRPFTKTLKLGYVSGRMVPLSSRSFLEEAVNVSRSVWDKVRVNWKNGQNVYPCSGRIYGLSRDFARVCHFPKTVWPDLGFYYFSCKKLGYNTFWAQDAVVNFRSPATVADYVGQISRYVSENNALETVFGPRIYEEYKIPKSLLYKFKLQVLLRYPLQCLVIFILNAYVSLRKVRYGNISYKRWQMAATTKKI